MKHCLIISREIFTSQLFFCLKILWLKAVNEFTACANNELVSQNLAKKVLGKMFDMCSIVPNQSLKTLHKIVEFLTLGLLSSLRNIYHSTTAYFFDPPCTFIWVQVNRSTLSRYVIRDSSPVVWYMFFKNFDSRFSFLVRAEAEGEEQYRLDSRGISQMNACAFWDREFPSLDKLILIRR